MGKGRRIPNAIAASKHHITANAISPTQLTTSIHTLQCNIQGLLPHNTLHTFECSLCSAHALHPASSGPAVPHPLLCGQCAGLLYNPFFFSLHLLDLVWSSSSLQNVLKSVMLNYKQVGQEGIMHKYVHVGYALGKWHGNPRPLLQSITSLLLYNIMRFITHLFPPIPII